MKHQWLAYVIVALLAIGAGVAIAGLPNDVPVDATIVAPITTEPLASTETTEVPTTTDTETTEVSESTEASESTEVSATTETTMTPDTTPPGPTDSVAGGIPERSELIVIVANGAGITGAAARNVVRLTDLGYVDVSPRDAVETVELTTIYYVEGFEAAAVRMAADLQLLSDLVAPLADAPEVLSLPPDVQLLAYIGVDRAR